MTDHEFSHLAADCDTCPEEEAFACAHCGTDRHFDWWTINEMAEAMASGVRALSEKLDEDAA